MAKRLVRARAKIRNAGIQFKTPALEQMDDRLEQVRAVIHLTFTEGHLTTDGSSAIDADQCDEAQWLAGHLCSLSNDAESRGLYALILIRNARRAARLDDRGHLVLFDEQDRDAWDMAFLDHARTPLAHSEPTTNDARRAEILHRADPL